jgi:hypothetical protein
LGCSEIFNFFVNAPTKAHEDDFKSTFKLMPNPVKNMLTIDLIGQSQPTSFKSISCFDVLGKEIYKSAIGIHSGKLTVDTERYSSGLYFIEISDENGARYLEKFVKE